MDSFPLYKEMLYTEPRGYVAYYSKFPSFYASPQPLIPAEPYIMHRERERKKEWEQWRIYYRMYQNGAVESYRNMNLGTSETVAFNSDLLVLIGYVEYGGCGGINVGYHAASMDKRISMYRRIVFSSNRRKTSRQWRNVIHLKGAFLKHTDETMWVLVLTKGKQWTCSMM